MRDANRVSDDRETAIRERYAWMGATREIETLLAALTQLRAERDGWQEFICANRHRWRAEDASTRCPTCGTTTFRGYDEIALASVPEEETT